MAIILVEAQALSSQREKFGAAAKACVEETRKELGSAAYDFYESQTAPNLFVFNEC